MAKKIPTKVMTPLTIKKIAFINQTLDVGGAETFNTDLLEDLVSNGIEVQAFVTHRPFARMLEERKISVEVLPVILDIIGNWKGLLKACFYLPAGIIQYWKLIRKLKKESTELILLSGFTEKICVTPFAYLHEIPVVWVEFGPLSTVLRKFGNLPKFLYRSVKDLPEAVIVPSLHTKSDLLQSGRISLAKIFVIPCGRAISQKDVAQKSQNPVKKHQILCVSRPEEGKGQDLLIRALLEVIRKYPDTQLLITGRNGTIETLKKLTQELGLEKHVQFVGWVDDVLQLMAESEICVFPSVWDLEGFGLVTIEAMAMSRPILAFRTGPTPEIITDQENGLLIESVSPKTLGKKILELIGNPELEKKIAFNASVHFQSNYRIEITTNKYIKVFLKSLASCKAKQLS